MNELALNLSRTKIRTLLFDLFAILFIAFAPAISHMIALPLYMLEPMRILLIASIVHTSRKNSYIIALLLPVFSIIISAHPSFYKALLISSELLLNVFLFSLLLNYFKNTFAAIFTSIVISKLFYYTAKFGMISFGMINGELISTPIYLQVIVTILLSVYIFLFYKKDNI
ncbi:MAG: hypothetical protein GYA14_15280 [Ignavibacteria bacterium]|nr:hypothetical protein [Ignavibacteria bacterium]